MLHKATLLVGFQIGWCVVSGFAEDFLLWLLYTKCHSNEHYLSCMPEYVILMSVVHSGCCTNLWTVLATRF